MDEKLLNENDLAIKIEGLKKRYRLGVIGGGTLRGDIESWWARKRGKEDPNAKIGTKQHEKNETFMALDGIDLKVKKGERLGIIGHNGAGKSTLLKLLSRVTAPTEGKIYLDGRISSMLEVGTGFSPELTGRENIYLNGAILGMTKDEVDRKIEDIIEFSEVRQFIDTPVKRYSSGMYVKLAFAVAAHLDSEILIMDEVLAVGDMAFQQKCLNKMSDVSKEEGRTILYVSHNMNTIRQLCERCIVMDHGTVIFDGDVEKAISMYLGFDSDEKPARYELTDSKRPSDFHGSKIHITDFTFSDKETAVFERTEPLKFKVGFDAYDNIKGLKMYFSIYASNNICAGTAQTFEPICDVTSGKHYDEEFRLDISNIIEGDYYFRLDLFSADSLGRHLSYDHPSQVINFSIVDSYKKGIAFKRQYTGSVMLNEIERVNVGL
ncbi:MAG: ATP-binding cassette domain-containing protein [Clostridia bacterium]|nr:ATP-binding cassette domain-containing protein [Clostridia bacterium]